MKPKSNLSVRPCLLVAAGSAFLCLGSARAATYNWQGDTDANFTETTNWVEDAWTQWDDYIFGAAVTSGAVTINGYFGINSLTLESGLGHDIVIASTNAQPVIMGIGVNGNPSALISIAADSKNLTIDGEYIAASAVTWDVGLGRTFTLNGPLNNWFNPAAIIKNGEGTAVLNGANGYSGGTTVNGGTLQLGVTGAIRGGGSVTVENGGTLLSNADWGTGGDSATGQLGPITVNAGGKLTANSAANGIRNGLTLNGGTVDAASGAPDNTNWAQFFMQSDLSVGGTSMSTISAALGVDGERTFDVGATGDASGVDLDITGRFTHLPGLRWGFVTKIGSGTMRVTQASGVGRITVSDGKLILEDAGAESNFSNGGLVTNATVEFKVTGGDRTFATASGGSGQIIKTGSGTLTLTGNVSHGGTTTVTDGTLALQGGGGGGTDYNGGNLNINGASTLRVSGERYNFGGEIFTFDSTGGGTLDAIASGAGGFVFTGNNTFATSGGAQNIISGTRIGAQNQGFNLDGDTAIFDVATGTDTTSDLVVTGTIWNGGNVIKNGAGRLEFAALQQYEGDTTINEGTLILGDGTNNTGLSNTGDVSIDSDAILVLNYDVADVDTIDKLFLDGVQVASGTWGSLASTATHKTALITGTGILDVLNGPPADPFANWMATEFPSILFPDNQPGADPDKDGIENLLEYILQGGDPLVSSTGTLPTLDASGPDFVFTFFRRAAATGTTQVFQYGTDLSGWTDLPVTHGGVIAISPDTPTSGIEQVVITLPKGIETEMFGRLKVTK